VARTRTTKKLAQRIDLNYFKRPTPWKRARLWLSVALPLLALVWIAWRGFSGDHRVYSSGRMSQAHAVLEKECAACHVQKAGAFSASAADSACLDCHDGPMHHENQVASAVPSCAACHAEHRGRVQLSTVSSQGCAECHGNLKVSKGTPRFAANIHSLGDGHPEVAALRDNAKDQTTIKLNHAIHMKPIRQGPNGPLVQLECSDCHGNYGATWKYALTQYPQLASYELHPGNPVDGVPHTAMTLRPPMPPSGRERMSPVKFSYACSGCHLLSFDKRFDEGVPHDTPEVVHAFVVKKFQEYIAAHPRELRVTREPDRDLTGKLLPPEVRLLTPAQWVAERTADAEELLRRKTCKQCHELQFGENEKDYTVAPALLREGWLPHAKFDHDAHRGFSCEGCHAKVLTSTESSDVLIPGITTCKTCHAPGPDHAESRCSECHTYHDWSKRKEVTPKFTLPALRSGGR
jgi:hypothetical protein